MIDNQATIANLVQAAHLDVETFETFVHEWQNLAGEQPDRSDPSGVNSRSRLRSVEQLTQKLLDKLVVADNEQEASASANKLFGTLKNSAIICDGQSQVLQANKSAMTAFGLQPGMYISDAGIEPEDGRKFRQHFWSSKDEEFPRPKLFFIRSVDSNDTPINMMASSVDTNQDSFLVVFISTNWDYDVYELLTSKFGLSEVEAKICCDFTTGISLRQISENRNRSYATIRNQFQSALEKTGCANQAELLQLLLGVSYLFAQLDYSAVEPAEFEPKKIEILRPNRRFFEVRLLGDMDGQPVVFLPGLFGLPATPRMDQKLRQSNLLMLGVMQSGFGGTSAPAPGHSFVDCLSSDICGLLDNLQVDKCILVGRTSSTRAVFNLERVIGDRIQKSFVVNACVPRKFIQSQSISSSWARSMINSFGVSRSITNFILMAGYKLVNQIGVEKLMSRIYASSEVDRKIFSDPDVNASVAKGIAAVFQQGSSVAAVDEATRSFEDWTLEVSLTSKKVTLIQGEHDPDLPIGAARAFGDCFPEQVEILEIKGGGAFLTYTHVEEVLDLILNHRPD